MTVSHVAEKVDITSGTITRLEKGEDVFYSSAKAVHEFYLLKEL